MSIDDNTIYARRTNESDEGRKRFYRLAWRVVAEGGKRDNAWRVVTEGGKGEWKRRNAAF